MDDEYAAEEESLYDLTTSAASIAHRILTLGGATYISSLPDIQAAFKRWCIKDQRATRSLAGMQKAKLLDAMSASGARRLGPEIAMLRHCFGPACEQPEEMLAFQDEWLTLPGDEFAASAAALAAETSAATARFLARLERSLGPTMVQVMRPELLIPQMAAPLIRNEGFVFDAAQRRRIWGAVGEQRLAAFEQHLNGSSYGWLEWAAAGVLTTMLWNFWKDWLLEERRQDLEAAGADTAARGMLAMQVHLELQARTAAAAAGAAGAAASSGPPQQQARAAAASSCRPPQQARAAAAASSILPPQQARAAGAAAAAAAAASSGPPPQQAQHAQQAAAASTHESAGTAADPEGDPAAWRVGQLKAFLAQRGVDCRHAVEKSQLVQLVQQALQEEERGGSASGGGGGGGGGGGSSRPGNAGQGSGAASGSTAAAAQPGVAAGRGAERGTEQAAGAPRRPAAPRICAASDCGATLNLRRCGGCATVRYCSEACSRAHWRAHRAQCRRLQAEQAADASTPAAAQARQP